MNPRILYPYPLQIRIQIQQKVFVDYLCSCILIVLHRLWDICVELIVPYNLWELHQTPERFHLPTHHLGQRAQVFKLCRQAIQQLRQPLLLLQVMSHIWQVVYLQCGWSHHFCCFLLLPPYTYLQYVQSLQFQFATACLVWHPLWIYFVTGDLIVDPMHNKGGPFMVIHITICGNTFCHKDKHRLQYAWKRLYWARTVPSCL